MSHRLTKEALDEQFELFLNEPVSDDSDKQLSAKSNQRSAQKPTLSWWEDDKHSDGGTRRGLLGSGKTFRKSLRKSIREEDEDPGGAGLKEGGLEAAVLSRDSLELEDSLMEPAVITTSIGLNTIEEEDEKAKFFAQLEAGALSKIDYSKLNRELDSTSSTVDTNLRRAEEAVEHSDDDQRKVKVTEVARESPAVTGSPYYSEDFEGEENGKELLEEKSKVSTILAKVSLHDSLDDTGGEDRRKETAGSLDRGQSYVQSGASEMEALHEAYRQIHVVEDSDDHGHRHSSVEGIINRPVSPSSLPQHVTQSLQPASTNDSELPTAEELMRPIRPEKDHIRGFTLQPVSAEGLDREKISCVLERTFSVVTSQESRLKQPENADPIVEIKATRGLTSYPSSSPDPPNLTWSIREEVERLMQDNNKCSSFMSSQVGKAKTQQASHGSTVLHSSTSSVRKPTMASVRGRRVEGRTAVTSRSSGLSRAAATAKTQSSVSRPLQHPREKAKFTKSQDKDTDTAESGVKVSSELMASVQSLVAVLHQQIDTSSHKDATDTQDGRGPRQTRLTNHLPNNNREEDSSLVEELRAQLAQKERELQIMREGTEELNSLRQQNYLLQSKLRSAEEASQRKRWAEATDSAAEEKFQQIDKEIKEQEILIKGYQQENEKLYLQMKTQQAKSKANEEAMFNENQRLLNELAFTREQINTSRTVGNVCSMDHTQRISDLLAQITMFQKNEVKLSEDIHRLKQEKQALEVGLQLMRKERDVATAQARPISGDKTFEMHVLEDKHREEVAALKNKLQWFAVNQELLDRDAGRLKAATAEVQQLKEQVEKLKLNVHNTRSEQKRKAKEKAVDTKRVNELEQIIKRRNRNPLPAHAAATAGASEDLAAQMSPPSRIDALLERRIQRLEAELESHDEEAKHSLRAMEQQFHRIKLRYEQQISELEQQLEQKQQLEAANLAAGTEPLMSQVGTLEEELQRVKEIHQEKEKSLHDQIESLQQQLKHMTQPSPGRHQRQAEAAFGTRIERLNQDLASKSRTIQELRHTVERLQKERKNMLSVPNPRPETRSTETKRQPGPAKTTTAGGEEIFPAAHYEKTYQPTVFTGSHISEVVQENEALKQHLELLEQQRQQEREALKADAAHAKEELCRLKENSAEQLSSMKAEHLRVLDQLRATHALEHSSSKVAELANKLNTQEVMVKHLQDQLKEVHRAMDALAISRTQDDALQKQVVGGSRHMFDTDQQSEVESWKRLAQDKARELEAFRLELDSILDILRHLQRQGVVLPTSDHP